MKKLLMFTSLMIFSAANADAMEIHNSNEYSIHCSVKINDLESSNIIEKRAKKKIGMSNLKEGDRVEVRIQVEHLQNWSSPETMQKIICFSPIENVRESIDYFSKLTLKYSVLSESMKDNRANIHEDPSARAALDLNINWRDEVINVMSFPIAQKVESYPKLHEKLEKCPRPSQEENVWVGVKEDAYLSIGLKSFRGASVGAQ